MYLLTAGRPGSEARRLPSWLSFAMKTTSVGLLELTKMTYIDIQMIPEPTLINYNASTSTFNEDPKHSYYIRSWGFATGAPNESNQAQTEAKNKSKSQTTQGC